jgi:hypothetical protein
VDYALIRPDVLKAGVRAVAHEAYKWTAGAYRSARAADSFRIALHTGETDPIAVYLA